MDNILIFTDLDGTLLDHHDYNFRAALPALKQIHDKQIPLIINSSKTYAEIKAIRQQMHNNCAFAVENGAAVFIPEENSAPNDSAYQQIILGSTIADIRTTLNQLREQYNYQFKGFSDFSIEQLMAETGLDEKQASEAKQRLASEPIKWLDSTDKRLEFEQHLQQQGLQLVKGGRFHHVMGNNDKSLAMAWLLNKLWQKQNFITLALGDSPNDRKMLEQADYAAIIKQRDNSYLEINKNPERVIYSEHPAPLGWQQAIDQLFAKIQSGDPS